MSATNVPVQIGSLDEVANHLGTFAMAFAYLQRISLGKTKDGASFFDLQLADAGGSVAAKIWGDQSEAIDAAGSLKKGDAVKVLFEPRTYRGSVQLNIRRIRAVAPDEEGYEVSKIFGEGFDLISDLDFRTLVFDIETVPAVDLRNVPPTIAKAVAKHAERGDGDEQKVMSLSPNFGKVVSIAVGEGEVDLDEQEPLVLVVPPPDCDVASLPDWIRPMSEPDLLRAFWLLCQRAELIVSFNGQGFDLPFLVTRSLIHGIPVTVDLLSNRFALRPHLDLHKVLNNNGRGLGPGSLDVYCWALGITSPKGEMDGSMVAPTYARGDIEMIATYNVGDVRATSAVYHHVRENLLRFRNDW